MSIYNSRAICESKTTYIRSNNRINILNAPRRPGDAEMLVSDIRKLKRMIDWTPKYNKLDFIIKTAIDWELKLQNEKIS